MALCTLYFLTNSVYYVRIQTNHSQLSALAKHPLRWPKSGRSEIYLCQEEMCLSQYVHWEGHQFFQEALELPWALPSALPLPHFKHLPHPSWDVTGLVPLLAGISSTHALQNWWIVTILCLQVSRKLPPGFNWCNTMMQVGVTHLFLS